LDNEKTRIISLQRLEKHEQQYKVLMEGLREVKMECKKNLVTHAQNQRQQLLSGGSNAVQAREKFTQESLLKTAATLTESLRRTTQLIGNEVEKSSTTLNVLAKSSETLEETKQEYKSQGSTIGTARTLISQLYQRDFMDKLLLFFAVAVYGLVVFYIMQKRIFSPATNPNEQQLIQKSEL